MNRQQRANENWREKFEALGLSDSFTFVSRDWSSEHGHKATVKCEKCGTVFATWALHEIYKGRQSRLICPECGAASDGVDVWERSAQCDTAMAFYGKGHTVKQTAEEFGVSESTVNNAVKKRGLTNGRNWGELSDAARERICEEAEQRLIERLDVLGFDYVGGYTNHAGTVTIKCRTCGEVFDRTVQRVQKETVVCFECQKQETKRRNAERRMEKARIRTEREAARVAKSLESSAYQLSRMLLLDDAHICKVCGKEYTLREYMESTGLRYYRDSGYCSAECRDAHTKERAKISHKGRRDSHRHRAVKYGCAYDSSVTLTKLIKRDGLRCAICGEMCDLNDHSWSEYSGPTYPSIDHIVPMSKGGGHVWGNVQVAHIICNSEKGANV